MRSFYREHKTSFAKLSPEEKTERIKDLGFVRNGFIELFKYQKHHDNKGIDAQEIFENAFKGVYASKEEQDYVIFGELPEYETE